MKFSRRKRKEQLAIHTTYRALKAYVDDLVQNYNSTGDQSKYE
jgi:hypothetical protein